jgi:hypothetical protein
MLKGIKACLAVACLSLSFTSCAMVATPVTGFVYTDVKAPLDATSGDMGTKTGTSECCSILGIVALGDASIQAAAQSAGITKIHHVDFKGWSVLGFYARFTTIVHGS